MLFSKDRAYALKNAGTLDVLAFNLRFRFQPLCVVFFHEGLYFFNDSANSKSVQEFAVVKKSGQSWLQVDTLAVGLMGVDELKEYLLRLYSGHEEFSAEVFPRISDGDGHDCELCRNC